MNTIHVLYVQYAIIHTEAINRSKLGNVVFVSGLYYLPFTMLSTKQATADRRTIIARKEKQLKDLEAKYYEMNDVISAKIRQLQEEREMGKSARVSKVRLETHHKNMTLDSTHRPSDREFSIRTYSNMDKNIWEYPDMRDWFNKMAPEGNPMEYMLRPADTGYTIRVDPTYHEPTAYEKNEMKQRILAATATTNKR